MTFLGNQADSKLLVELEVLKNVELNSNVVLLISIDFHLFIVMSHTHDTLLAISVYVKLFLCTN